MPVFLFDRVLDMARRVNRFLRNPKNTLMHRRMRSKRDEFKQIKHEVKSKRPVEYKHQKSEVATLQGAIKGKKQEAEQIGKEVLAADDPAKRREHRERKQRILQEKSRLKAELNAARKRGRATNVGRKMKKKTIQQEIFQLQRERRAVHERRSQLAPDGGRPVPLAEGEPGTGALPDFVIIGGKKCGTTFLYHLLTQHPLVQPAASKELHFFDVHFDLGVEWYRRFFPAPRWEDGRRTITGEATPYMSHPLSSERTAGVIPEARLIALLRNPVERAYSDYQMVSRKERESRTFEEAIAAAEKSRPAGEAPDRAGRDDARGGYLSRSIYVDQLLPWSEYFGREQLLVLKSEDFFESPQQTLKVVLEFLDLPDWEPGAEELMGSKRNEGDYGWEMDPDTRRRLEEYFEPHNQRLYDFLGIDFGW